MLRSSLSRKIYTVAQFSRTAAMLLAEPSSLIVPLVSYPVRLEVTATVGGAPNENGALMPIKELQTLLAAAIATCEGVVFEELEAYGQNVLASMGLAEFNLAIEVASENLTKVSIVRDRTATTSLSYFIRFLHTVDFDRDEQGNLLHHGHDARLEFEFTQVDRTAFDQYFNAHLRGHVDKANLGNLLPISTGEAITHWLFDYVVRDPRFKNLLRVSLHETDKNRFSSEDDRPLTSAHTQKGQ